jgi:hypothetical protein
VIEASRLKAREASARPASRAAAVAIIAIWVLCVAGSGYWVWGQLDR